jgi:hypothetical protein
MMAIDLSSYNTVAERIAEFAAKYPDGNLSTTTAATPTSSTRKGRSEMNIDLQLLDIDDLNYVAGYVWSETPYSAKRTLYDGVEGECATVTVNGVQFAIGFDPNEDGILWAISADTFGDGSQWDMVESDGWAPGDEATATLQIAGIINTLNQKGVI